MAKQYNEPTEENYSLRQRFSNKVREWGNNRTPALKSRIGIGKGLGDLLTADINFKRVGAVAGGLVPVVACGWLASTQLSQMNNEAPIWAKTIGYTLGTALVYAATYIISLPATIFGGIMGYKAGKKVDNLFVKSEEEK